MCPQTLVLNVCSLDCSLDRHLRICKKRNLGGAVPQNYWHGNVRIGTEIQDFRLSWWFWHRLNLTTSAGTKPQVIPEWSTDESLLETLCACGRATVVTHTYTTHTQHTQHTFSFFINESDSSRVCLGFLLFHLCFLSVPSLSSLRSPQTHLWSHSWRKATWIKEKGNFCKYFIN